MFLSENVRSLTSGVLPSSLQIMKRLVAIRTPPIEQSQPWKVQTLFWMDRIPLERTPLQSALWLQWGRATSCLQSRLVAGVLPVLQHHRPLTSMENPQPASQMVKVEDGLIRFMLSKVSQTVFNCSLPGVYLIKCRLLVILSNLILYFRCDMFYVAHTISTLLEQGRKQRLRWCDISKRNPFYSIISSLWNYRLFPRPV